MQAVTLLVTALAAAMLEGVAAGVVVLGMLARFRLAGGVVTLVVGAVPRDRSARAGRGTFVG